MNLIIHEYLNKLASEGKSFRNVLVYNSIVVHSPEIVSLANVCNEITFAYNNNFLVNSLVNRLRFYKNLHFYNLETIVNRFFLSTFDLVIMNGADINLINAISSNDFVQYFIILNESNSDVLRLPLFDHIGSNVYKRNRTKLIVDVSKDEDQYKKDLEKLSSFDKIFDNNQLNKEIKVNKSIIKQSAKISYQDEFSTINVKNLTPHETIYSNNFKFNFHDGILAISMVISNNDDFLKFKDCKEKILSQYENVKYYIILNGSDSFQFQKYFNESSFLLKNETSLEIGYYLKQFDAIIKNEYHLNLNKFEIFNMENIWDLV